MTIRLLISGKVQGVWFRDSTREAAERFGADGWIRNLPDGRVEAMIGGPSDAVERLVAWCHHGPSKARVDDVHQEHTDENVAPGFRVIRAGSR